MLGNILLWILIGILAGLVVSIIYPKAKGYMTGTIGAGIIGAILGGILYSGLKIGEISKNIDITSLIVAVCGAGALMLFIFMLIKNEGINKKI